MNSNHEDLIKECLKIAKDAQNHGNHPFGALLTNVEGNILLRAENTVNTEKDATCHAEMNLIRAVAKQLTAEQLSNSILYTSTEPCAMCTGAIYWSGISTVVYGCPAKVLGEIAGGGFIFSTEELLAEGERNVMVIGPILEKESAELHRHFWKK
jgi:tRNA(Arg) A34 adenosine deaminase TadA